MAPPRLAVAVSGAGTLLEAMILAKIPISFVFSDRNCRGLHIAVNARIPTSLIPRTLYKGHFDRAGYTDKVLHELQHLYEIDYVAMAGFMTFFAPRMFAEDAYKLKVLNTHPSLLPSFKGDHAVRDALEFGVKVTGCTIHYATENLDEGPIIAQKAVEVMPNDSEETLHERIKQVERKLYPSVLKNLLSL